MIVKQVNVQALNVRKTPSTSAPILMQITLGKQVSVISESNGWSTIQFDNNSGFVASQYLSPLDHSDTADLSLTPAKIMSLAPGAHSDIVNGLFPDIVNVFQKYGITTHLRICHFFAQAAQECDGFRTLVEYGSPSYFSRYDNRPDLGNTHPGDGYKYRGRGIFQITGRNNYQIYGNYIGVDLVSNPDQAATSKISLLTACEFWFRHGLNQYADNDDIVTITHRINGGENGLDNRKLYLARAKTIW